MSATTPCRPFIYAYEPDSFSFSFIYSFLAYYVIFTGLEFGLTHFFRPFRKLSKLQQRNFLVYVSELVVTTCLLVPWIVFGVQLFTGSNPPEESTLRGIVLIAVFVVNLYLYEIAYKIAIPKSLMLHHVSTMLLVVLAVYRYQYNAKIVSVRGVFTLGLTALTEQSTFFALILYRVKKEWCLWPMLFASVFTLVSKTALLAWTIQIVVDGGDDFWYYTFGPTAGILFVSQIYGAYILFAIWRKARNDLRKERLNKMNGIEPEDSDLDSLDADDEKARRRSSGSGSTNGGGENGHVASRERKLTELRTSAGARPKSNASKKAEDEEDVERAEALPDAPTPRSRADSGMDRFVAAVRLRSSSIAASVVEHVRMDDEHVEDVV